MIVQFYRRLKLFSFSSPISAWGEVINVDLIGAGCNPDGYESSPFYCKIK